MLIEIAFRIICKVKKAAYLNSISRVDFTMSIYLMNIKHILVLAGKLISKPTILFLVSYG